MLPLGVIIPTRNSMSLLPGHLARLSAWIHEAREVVCVDSFSTDGTLALLKAGLKHPRLKILSHPPGLYPSWNFGIQQITSSYVYIATVGDVIRPDGLRHLIETAQRFQSELVLSPPRFRSTRGQVLESKQWTIHQYLEALRITAPRPLPRSHLFISSVFAGTSGMMGSSASNLYEATLLQRHPFPADFAHIGDTAWGVQNALRVRSAITPEPCADFVIHPNEGRFRRDKQAELEEKLLTAAREVLRDAVTTGAIPPGAEDLMGIFDKYEIHHRQEQAWDDAYYRRRKSTFPWFFDPSAWKARATRDRHSQIVENLWLQTLDRFSF